MHEKARAWFGVCATFLALTLPSAAGAQVLGTVAGNVKDASGAVLPGVTVEVSSPALIEKVRTAVTDGNGQYQIVNLPPGVYSVTFTLPGFQHRQARRARGVGELHVHRGRGDEGRQRRGDHHGHRREPDRRHPVGGADAVGDVARPSRSCRRAVRGFRWRRSCRPSAPRTPTWAACSATRPAPRCRRTAARNGDGVSMIDGLRIGNMYHQLEPDEHEPVAAAVRPGGHPAVGTVG